MRRVYCFLLLCSAVFGSFAQADVVTSQNLNYADSFVLAEKIELAMGKTILPSEDDSQLILYRSYFASSDASVAILCERSLKGGVFVGAVCYVEFDSTLSGGAEYSKFLIGAVGEVKVAQLFKMSDLESLAKTLAPVGRYSTTEQVEVLVDGQKQSFPKFQISCGESSQSGKSCQLAIFP